MGFQKEMVMDSSDFVLLSDYVPEIIQEMLLNQLVSIQRNYRQR